MTLEIVSPSTPDFRISGKPPVPPVPRFGLAVSDRLKLAVALAVAGPPGASGDAAEIYTHTQASASALWTINHNLGRTPAGVSAYTTGGVEIEGAVLVVSPNQVTIEFGVPIAGTARIT